MSSAHRCHGPAFGRQENAPVESEIRADLEAYGRYAFETPFGATLVVAKDGEKYYIEAGGTEWFWTEDEAVYEALNILDSWQ